MRSSPAFPSLSRHHPFDGPLALTGTLGGATSDAAASSGTSPYSLLCGASDRRIASSGTDATEPGVDSRSYARAQRAVLDFPSSQLVHVSALLPGYSFVHVPGQLYLE